MKFKRYEPEEDAIILKSIQRMMVATEIAEALTQAGYPRDYGSVYMHCRDALKVEIPKRTAKPTKRTFRGRFVIGRANRLTAHAKNPAVARQWQSWLDKIADHLCVSLEGRPSYPTYVTQLDYALCAGAEKSSGTKLSGEVTSLKMPLRPRGRFVMGKSNQLSAHAGDAGIVRRWQGWLDIISENMKDAGGYPTFTKLLPYSLRAGAEKSEKAEREAAE